MRRLGIADLGSNTARLVAFAYEPGEWFKIVDGIRETVRLGAGLVRRGRLTGDAIERAVAALELFADYARAADVERVEVLGTSALRDAANREEFLAAIREIDLPIRVLSGEEEAELGVMAVANGFPFDDAWVMDLGGGSAQISAMRGRRYVEGTAHPLGAVRLTEAFLDSDPPTRAEVGALEAFVEEELGDLADRLDGRAPLVAIGGTVRNLARMAQKRQDYPLAMLHGYRFTRDALEDVTARLLRAPVKRRAAMRGLNPERADIIVAGALVFRWILRRSGLDELVISGHGVREGAFYRHFLPPPHLVDDVRRFSVRNRAAQYPQPPGHVERVRRLAKRLFDELSPLHDLGSAERELLDAAAMLHDSGIVLDYYRHHKHGAYMLVSSSLDGFSHREQALLAQLIRYHRRGKPRLGPFESLARAGDRARLAQLAACLRLAESFERSRAGRVRDLGVEIGKKAVTIRLVSAEEPTVELWEASKHERVFRRAFDRRLELEAAVRAEAAATAL